MRPRIPKQQNTSTANTEALNTVIFIISVIICTLVATGVIL